MGDLFDGQPVDKIGICEDMWLLPGFADDAALQPLIDTVCNRAPLRHMVTPGGRSMSVGMTNCGSLGWVSDARGYRYQPLDPQSGQPWPAMPAAFRRLATTAARTAGFGDFAPDACLLNCYRPGSQMTAHQDRNEQDFSQPIVSVSLGLTARFFVQGPERRGKSIGVDLASGDVVVWGGRSRLYFHGVRRLKEGSHTLFGPLRYNLTFRRAGSQSAEIHEKI